MFESCLRNTKARFSGFFLCCLGWTLHMLPVAVLCKQSVASNDYESCLRKKKKRELFKHAFLLKVIKSLLHFAHYFLKILLSSPNGVAHSTIPRTNSLFYTVLRVVK